MHCLLFFKFLTSFFFFLDIYPKATFFSSSWPICFSFIYLLLNLDTYSFFSIWSNHMTLFFWYLLLTSLFRSPLFRAQVVLTLYLFLSCPFRCFQLWCFWLSLGTTFPKRICPPKMCQWVVPSLCEVWQEGVWRQTYSVELPSHELSPDQIKELYPHPYSIQKALKMRLFKCALETEAKMREAYLSGDEPGHLGLCYNFIILVITFCHVWCRLFSIPKTTQKLLIDAS